MPSVTTTTPLVPPAAQELGAPTLEELLRHAAPPAQRVLRALLAAQARHQLFQPEQAVVVAVSGGADSVCLLHALYQLAPYWQITLHVAHLDHALRPDSADDAAFVANLAHQLGLPYYQKRLAPGTLDDDPQGLEAAARLARYAFLRDIAMQFAGNAAILGGTANASRDAGVPGVTIATAHHQDDQAETLLLHLVQGSGLQGLAGMAWVGSVPDNVEPRLRLVRPLLGVSRAEIQDYLHSYGLAWHEDSSNADPAHLRNQLRHTILPQLADINPNIHATLARTAALLAAEADHAAARDRASLESLLHEYMPSTRLVLEWFPLTQTDQATQRGAVCQAMRTLGIDLRAVGMEGIDGVLDQARTGAPSGPHPLIAGWSWTLLRATSAVSTPVGQAEEGVPRFGQEESLLLAIHRTRTMPLRAQHPHFTAPITPALPIPQQGVLLQGGWQLYSVQRAPADLPADWRNQPWRFFADADAAGDLYLTTFQPGMSMAPLGMEGHKRTLGDIFTDRKVPPYLRAGWPVVVNEHGVVMWLCGLVVAENVRIHAQTRRVRGLRWQLETTSP